MAVDVLDVVLRMSGVGHLLTGFRQVSGAASEASNKQVEFHRSGVAAFAGLGATSVLIGSGLRNATRAAGEFEGKVMAFSRLFGGENFAKEMLDDLRKFSGESNFTFGGSVQFAQRLRAMGFEARDLIPIMGTLGDAVAATGGGHDELDRVILAFGQIRTRGKLAQQEINQLSQANIPAMEILAENLHLTDEQLKDIGRHGIDSATAINALLAGLSSRYGGQMEVFLKSMPGQLHQLRNQWEMLRLEIGKPLVPGTKGLVQGLGLVTKGAAAVPGIGAGIGGLGMAAAGVTGAMSINAMARMAGMTMKFMGEATGSGVSPLAGGLAQGGIAAGISSMLGKNPQQTAEISQYNAGVRQLYKEDLEAWKRDVAQNRVARRQALSKGLAPPLIPVRPAEPTYQPLPGINRGALMRGAGLGLLAAGAAIGGGMLLSHAETQKDQGTRYWEAFLGGALTGGTTGAMMGMAFGGTGGAIGAGLVGALLGGWSSAQGIGEFSSAANSKQEKYSQEQLDKLDKIHQAIVAGTEGQIMQSQILAGGEDVRRPFPQSDFARAVGEGF